MKVLFFCNFVPDKTGSFEIFLRELGRIFTENGDELILVLSGEPIPSVAGEWQAVRLGWEIIPGWVGSRGAAKPWGFCFPALKLLGKHRPDVAVVHFGNELPSLLTSWLSKLNGSENVRWVWQQDQQIRDPSWITTSLSRIRLLSLVFDHFVTVYEGGRKSLLRRGIMPDHVTVIRNGVNEHEKQKQEGWLRREEDIPVDVVLAVGVGSFIPRKRLDFVVKAIANVHVTYPQVHLILVGEGPGKADLARMVELMGISEIVHFMGARNDVRDILAEGDVFLHSAVAEASSYAVAESMAAGIPAVITAAGAASEQVIDNETGYVVGKDDISGFADRIVALARDAGLRKRMGAAAHRRWADCYRVETSAMEYHRLYHQVRLSRSTVS
jgi:glycosyltransferase involved in cell wall biosynthesis